MAHVAYPGIQKEAYISIDVETSGPNPSEYDMLSIGACLAEDPVGGDAEDLRRDGERRRPSNVHAAGQYRPGRPLLV